MTFRQPFTFTPVNFKIGYYKYGGNKYWSDWRNVFKGQESLDSSPFQFIYNDNIFEDVLKNQRMKNPEESLIKLYNHDSFQCDKIHKVLKNMDCSMFSLPR